MATKDPTLSAAINPRVRKSPFFDATVEDGLTSVTTYNHMWLPSSSGDALVQLVTTVDTSAADGGAASMPRWSTSRGRSSTIPSSFGSATGRGASRSLTPTPASGSMRSEKPGPWMPRSASWTRRRWSSKDRWLTTCSATSGATGRRTWPTSNVAPPRSERGRSSCAGRAGATRVASSCSSTTRDRPWTSGGWCGTPAPSSTSDRVPPTSPNGSRTCCCPTGPTPGSRPTRGGDHAGAGTAALGHVRGAALRRRALIRRTGPCAAAGSSSGLVTQR
ncbi:hypothetical protein BH24ACT4_BH24ACT4_06690 [soil metagenome]